MRWSPDSQPHCPGPRRRVGSYAEYEAPASLRRYVRCLWTYRWHAQHAVTSHRVLPHGGLSVCFRYVPGEASGVSSQAFLFGPVHRARTFAPQPGEVLQALELRPEWVRSLLGIAPEEHVGAIRPWEDVDGARSLGLPLRGRPDADSIFRVLLAWVEGRVPELRPGTSATIAHAGLTLLRDSPGMQVSVAAASLGVSIRHLRRAVRDTVGSSPKHLQRLARLNRVVMEADGLDVPRWAGLAVRHGFYDQAHLILEVRSLTGVTPTVLHSERRAQPVPFFQSPSISTR